jgi:hypothetical protein
MAPDWMRDYSTREFSNFDRQVRRSSGQHGGFGPHGRRNEEFKGLLNPGGRGPRDKRFRDPQGSELDGFERMGALRMR